MNGMLQLTSRQKQFHKWFESSQVNTNDIIHET